MNPETITLIAGFLRNLREGRPSSTEEWNTMGKFLEEGFKEFLKRMEINYRNVRIAVRSVDQIDEKT